MYTEDAIFFVASVSYVLACMHQQPESGRESECMWEREGICCEQLMKKFYEQTKVRVDQLRFQNNPEKIEYIHDLLRDKKEKVAKHE